MIRDFNTLPPPPISDAFVIKDYFICIIQMIKLWHYLERDCSISINKIFLSLLLKHLKWGDKVLKRVSPIIQFSTIWCRKYVLTSLLTGRFWTSLALFKPWRQQQHGRPQLHQQRLHGGHHQTGMLQISRHGLTLVLPKAD